MGGWTSARPSIEKKLKALGYKDNELDFIWKTNPSDRAKLTENVDKLIAKKKDKEKQVKGALKENFSWFK